MRYKTLFSDYKSICFQFFVEIKNQKCGGPGVYWVLKGSEERIPKEMCKQRFLFFTILTFQFFTLQIF